MTAVKTIYFVCEQHFLQKISVMIQYCGLRMLTNQNNGVEQTKADENFWSTFVLLCLSRGINNLKKFNPKCDSKKNLLKSPLALFVRMI